jgi:3-deoxy-D-manno-octulosonic-acid transferase
VRKDTILHGSKTTSKLLGFRGFCLYICHKTIFLALFCYNIFLLLYFLGVRLLSWKNKKARLWLAGRRNIFADLSNWKNKIGTSHKIIWVHCASLGEFEQGRPVIEKLKQNYPNHKILLTFFSPSGYEIRKNYNKVDGVFYLPMDGKTNATKFIDIIKPSLVIWVKYEYWYYYLTTLKKQNIPVVLISAIFRKNQPFFKWYAAFWKKVLFSFEKICVQNEDSLILLKSIGFNEKLILAGDTRFDRVIDNAENKTVFPKDLMQFCKNKKVIVAGSTWEEDEQLLVHYARSHKDVQFIIAPHETDDERITEIEKLFVGAVRYSDFIAGKEAVQIIIIDNVGMLSKLYELASIAYIGGGFNDSGIHNILEAAVYGKPIVFATQYEKFKEAVDLVDTEGAYSINNALELESFLNKYLTDDIALENAGNICKEYVYEKQGATEKIMQYLTQISF